VGGASYDGEGFGKCSELGNSQPGRAAFEKLGTEDHHSIRRKSVLEIDERKGRRNEKISNRIAVLLGAARRKKKVSLCSGRAELVEDVVEGLRGP